MIQRFSDVNIHIHIQWFRNTVMQKIYTSTPRCDAKYRDAKWQGHNKWGWNAETYECSDAGL